MELEIKEEILKYNNYLLLQGPEGFFFYKLAKFLKKHGKNVYKINFNGGDLIIFPFFRNVYNYRKKIEYFEKYLENFIFSKKVEVILLYGDYRPYHKIAINLCERLNIPAYVFEEGYVRPYYITLEKGGINGWSKLPKNPDFYRNLPDIKISDPFPTNYSYTKKAIFNFIYYIFLEILRWYFPHYIPYKKHFPYIHRVFFYCRGGLRKFIYKIKEKKVFDLLNTKLKYKYFFVPLQVYNDTQITIHSKYNSIEDFIFEVIESFAKNSKNNLYLVFKHHPEDRGFKNYKKFIKKVAEKFNIKDRVFYLHDFHLPTLIKGSLGVVVVNSTVGLQALYHNRPVKVMGKAIYDIQGLTFQGSLDKFWQNPGKIDRKLFEKFRNYVIKTTQLNGSFYGRFPFDSDSLSSINLKTFSTESSKAKR